MQPLVTGSTTEHLISVSGRQSSHPPLHILLPISLCFDLYSFPRLSPIVGCLRPSSDAGSIQETQTGTIQ